MIDIIKSALTGQFHAALSMLKAAVDQCPDEYWQLRVGNWQFSHVAYHALFYADFYLSPDEGSYCRPEFYREEFEFFGATKLPSDQEPIADFPFPREDVLRYIEHCRRKASDAIAAETAESLAGPPGFWWYKIPRAEFHLNNVRHIQHHAAQMSLALRRAAGIDVGWVGTG